MASQIISPAGWERTKDPPNSVSGSRPEVSSEEIASRARAQQDFLQEARERFRVSADAENPRRGEMLTDQKFRAGDQWDKNIQAQRDEQKRPCLTINRIDGFLSHVVNDLREKRPEIKIDPLAAGADEEIAEIRQGLIRHIEQISRAEAAYDSSFENMATMGLGYMRVVDGWSEDGNVYDKDLFIQWVPNTFSVYEDPAASKPDWSDGRYKFIVEDISLSEFRRRFGKEKSPVSLSEFASIGDAQLYWLRDGKIRIAEYFHIEEEDDVLYQLSDDSRVYESQLTDEQLGLVRLAEDGTADPRFYREDKRKKVMWSLMYGLGVLKEREWKGKYIPVIPVIGNQIHLDGELILVGMVRYAREAQRMFNYMYSCFVEACALAPKAPFIAAFAQVEAFLDSWNNANINPQSVLFYNPVSQEGHLAPPPQRSQAEPPIAAFVEGLKLSDQNLKATFRIFDASLGQKGPQESGIAINSRKVESDLATYNWIDNFARAQQFLGIVLDDLLPYYYNSPGRIIQILQEDMSQKAVTFNQAHEVNGETKIYDLSKGKFAVRVGTGPSYPTRRREAAAAMVEMAKVLPIIGQAAPVQMIRAQDWPDKDIIADQVEKALPPELRTTDKDKTPQQDLVQLKQIADQLNQQNQALTQAVHTLTDQKETERMKEEWATLRTGITAEAGIAVAEMKAGVEQAKVLTAEIFEEMKRIRAVLDPSSQPGQQPTSSAPASAAASPQAPAQPVPSPEANTPSAVGSGQPSA